MVGMCTISQSNWSLTTGHIRLQSLTERKWMATLPLAKGVIPLLSRPRPPQAASISARSGLPAMFQRVFLIQSIIQVWAWALAGMSSCHFIWS